MKYSITWKHKSARIDYSGDIETQDILSAHEELNKDDRFYDCRQLILNATDCDVEKVSVPDLMSVVAQELGAAHTNSSLKVAMIVNNSASIDKASNYISLFQFHESPWEFRIFNSVDESSEWLNS